MSWVAVGMGTASALMGANQAKQKQKTEQASMIANAEQIRYSPWTGMNASIQGPSGANDPGAAALQGAVGGAMMGQQFKGMGAGMTSTPDASSMAKPAADMSSPSSMGMADSMISQSSAFQPMEMGQGMGSGMDQMQPPGMLAVNKKPGLYK